MNIQEFKSARDVLEALLADRSVETPMYFSDHDGRLMPERRYSLSDVGSRISEDKRRLIESKSLTDMCEAGRLMRFALHDEARALANELFADWQEQAA